MKKELYIVTTKEINEEKTHYMLVDSIKDIEKCFFDSEIIKIEPKTLANVEYMIDRYSRR